MEDARFLAANLWSCANVEIDTHIECWIICSHIELGYLLTDIFYKSVLYEKKKSW